MSPSCAKCGRDMPSGSRAVSPEQRMRELIQTLGATLYSERFDNRSWFFLTPEQTSALMQEKPNQDRLAYDRIFKAMGASRIEYGLSAARKSPLQVMGPEGLFVLQSKVTSGFGGLNPDLREVVALDAAQTSKLRAAGVGFMANSERPGRTRSDDPMQAAELIPMPSLFEYAEGRARGKKPSERVKVVGPDRVYFDSIVLQYVKRNWSLYVLEQTGFKDPSKRLPMHGRKGQAGLVSAGKVHGLLRFRLMLPAEVPEVPSQGLYVVDPASCPQGMPTLQALDKQGQPVVVFHVAGAGGLDLQTRAGGVLTLTSKMSAPSFSLPAGPALGGGTCSSAELKREEVYDVKDHICTICYATGANYLKSVNVWSGGVSLGWVIDTLREDGGDKRLGDSLTAAICAYARHGLRGPSKTSKTEEEEGEESASFTRGDVEIGVWNPSLSKIMVPPSRSLKPIDPTPFLQKQLKLSSRDTSSLFLGAKNGEVVGFFRVHDSGDFSVPGVESAYLRAWKICFTALPHVRFWAPTRRWATSVRQGERVSEGVRGWISMSEAMGVRGARPGTASSFAKGSRSVITGVSVRLETLLDRAELGLPMMAEGLFEAGVRNVLCFEPDEDSPPGSGDGFTFQSFLGGSEFTYAPESSPVVKALIDICATLSNVAIRPSALYVKTPHNPAAIPFVSSPVGEDNGLPYGRGANALSAGSGVAVKWGSSRGLRTAARAAAAGVNPQDYVPVYDTRGLAAWQCPVYSETTPKKVVGGEVEYMEAKSCRAAGCRACWILPNLPIAYGYH